MKAITLNDVTHEQMKNEDFAVKYKRGLLINAIAELIVRLRKNKRLTQAQLAAKIGTTQSVIARLESGHDSRIPSLDVLARIADATHTKINIVFEDE